MNYVSSQSFHTLNHWQNGTGSSGSCGTDLYDGYEKDGWSIWGVKDSDGNIALLPSMWYEDGYNKEPTYYTSDFSGDLVNKHYSPIPEFSENKLIKGYKTSSGVQYGLYGPYETKTIGTRPSKEYVSSNISPITYIEATYSKKDKRFVSKVASESGYVTSSDYTGTIDFNKNYVGNAIELEIEKYIVVLNTSGSLTGDFDDISTGSAIPLYNHFTDLNELICPMPDNTKDFTLIYPGNLYTPSITGHIGLMNVDYRYGYTEYRDTTGGYIDTTLDKSGLITQPGWYVAQGGSAQFGGTVATFWTYDNTNQDYISNGISASYEAGSTALYGTTTYGNHFYSYDSSGNQFVVLRRIKKINIIKDFAFFS